MIMLNVKIQTSLDHKEMERIARERKPEFEAIPGLVQKYYVRYSEPNMYGGVYIWDSMESLQAFQASDLAATIAKAYKATSPPEVSVSRVMFPLRD